MNSSDVADVAAAFRTLGSAGDDSAELIDQISGLEALKAMVSAAQARATAAFAAKQRAVQRAAGVPSRDVGKGVGRVRVFTKAGAKPYTLRMTRPGRGVLLDGAGGPRVELVRGGATVSGLPEGAGIVELTLYTQKATQPRALLTRGKKASLGVTSTSGGAPVRLSSVLVGRGR